MSIAIREVKGLLPSRGIGFDYLLRDQVQCVSQLVLQESGLRTNAYEAPMLYQASWLSFYGIATPSFSSQVDLVPTAGHLHA